MFDLSKSLRPSPAAAPLFGLPLRLFRGSSSRLCLVLSDIDHSNSLRSPSAFCPLRPYPLPPRSALLPTRRHSPRSAVVPLFSSRREAPNCRFLLRYSLAPRRTRRRPVDAAALARPASPRRGCVGHASRVGRIVCVSGESSIGRAGY